MNVLVNWLESRFSVEDFSCQIPCFNPPRDFVSFDTNFRPNTWIKQVHMILFGFHLASKLSSFSIFLVFPDETVMIIKVRMKNFQDLSAILNITGTWWRARNILRRNGFCTIKSIRGRSRVIKRTRKRMKFRRKLIIVLPCNMEAVKPVKQRDPAKFQESLKILIWICSAVCWTSSLYLLPAYEMSCSWTSILLGKPETC